MCVCVYGLVRGERGPSPPHCPLLSLASPTTAHLSHVSYPPSLLLPPNRPSLYCMYTDMYKHMYAYATHFEHPLDLDEEPPLLPLEQAVVMPRLRWHERVVADEKQRAAGEGVGFDAVCAYISGVCVCDGGMRGVEEYDAAQRLRGPTDAPHPIPPSARTHSPSLQRHVRDRLRRVGGHLPGVAAAQMLDP